ncbi:MAG: hypothetical protein JRI53_03040 [Deltaproteobacteria bacterium]|nr:hypothetical protein [Deltaproteobacteria bacterium]MBW1983670.1 hypothetical protein [Deltaproteobacteria bacterium]
METFICKASKGEAIVKLLRTLSNGAYGSLRFAHRVKIDEKLEGYSFFTIWVNRFNVKVLLELL